MLIKIPHKETRIMFTVGSVDRYIGRQSMDSRSIVDRQSIDSRSTVDRKSIDSRSIVDR